MANAASAALPPSSRICVPADAALGSAALTIPLTDGGEETAGFEDRPSNAAPAMRIFQECMRFELLGPDCLGNVAKTGAFQARCKAKGDCSCD